MAQASLIKEKVDTMRGMEASPPALQLEITNACNGKCIICPNPQQTRPRGMMSFKLWCKLLHQAVELNITLLHPFWFGEPTLVKDFPKYLDAIGDIHPNAMTQLFSNCSNLTDEIGEAILRNNIDLLVVSFEGGTKQTYESHRPGLKWDKTVINVHNFVRKRNEAGMRIPEVFVQSASTYQTRAEFELLKAEFSDCNQVNLTALQTMGGTIDESIDVPKVRKNPSWPCMRLWSEIVVAWDGRVVTCCDDWDTKQVVGNANEQTLLEIWKGDKLRAYRDASINNSLDGLPTCSTCWYEWIGVPEWWKV